MANQEHANWLKEGVKKWNLRRRKVQFKPDLSGIRLYDFLPLDFRDAPKTSRFFEGINLSDALLSESDLSDLNFFGSNFKRANLTDADMSMSNFGNSIFDEATLEGANAKLSFFDGAKFFRANLSRVNFGGASISLAIFIETDLSFSRNLPLQTSDLKTFAKATEYSQYLGKVSVPVDRSLEKQTAAPDRPTVDDRERKNSYDVFFATNRNEIFERGELVRFGSENAEKITYGISEVIIPDGHRTGSIGSPLWRRLVNRRDDRLKMANIVSLTRELYWKFLQDTYSKMKVKAIPTLFVHGYNTNFDDAVIRAAQIGYDLGIGQGVGLFSWPSKGRVAGYLADEDMVQVSKSFLADFIEEFSSRSPTGDFNIISHSMGCRCLMGAIEILSQRKPNAFKSINQMILAAADVNQQLIEAQCIRAIGACDRITSYASDSDRALQVSGWLHSFPRVGLTPPTFILSGVDTIIVNDKDLGDFGHGYIGSSRAVLNDVFYLLKHGLSPHERHSLQEVSNSFGLHWRIKA